MDKKGGNYMAVNTNNWGVGDVVIKYDNSDICHTVNPASYQSPAADGSTIAGLTNPTDEKFGVAPFEHVLKLRNSADGDGNYQWFHPTPYVSISSDMITQAKRLGQGRKITLDGVLMCGWGHCGSDCWEEREAFINRWATNFKDLTIEEDDVEIMRFQHCKVESIDFEESSMANAKLGYSVTLSSFDNWSGTLGVTEPTEDFSFSEGEDDVISMTHNVSAKGFDATVGGFHYSAFNNAKNYVIGLSGFDPVAAPVIPQFIDKASDGKIYPLLISQTETADRMAGTYSISENWQFSQHSSDGGAPVGYQPIDTISISHNHPGADGDENRSTVTLTRKGGLDKFIDVATLGKTPSAAYLRSLIVANLTTFSANENQSALNDWPEEFSVEENTFNNTATYTATFSDFNPFGDEKVIFDPSYSFSEDTSKESFEITISGPLKAKAQSQKQKAIDIEEWIAEKEQYTSRLVGLTTVHGGSPGSTKPLGVHGYLYDLVSTFYSSNSFCTATMPGYAHPHSHDIETRRNFHPRPTSFSVSRNPNSAEYTLSATFNSDPNYNQFTNSDGSLHPGSSLIRWNYNIEVQHGIHQFRPHADVHNHGYYVIYDLLAHRAERVTISVDVNDIPAHPGVTYRKLGDYNGGAVQFLTPTNNLRDLIYGTFSEEGHNGFVNWQILSESTNGEVRNENRNWSVQLIQNMDAGQAANYELIRDDEMYIPPR